MNGTDLGMRSLIFDEIWFPFPTVLEPSEFSHSLSLRSIASLQRIGKYASARRFLARLASALLNRKIRARIVSQRPLEW
jgi:hypothetical protein